MTINDLYHTVARNGCQPDWTRFVNSCYVFIANTLAPYDIAQVMCQDMDATLVTIETKQENHFVVELVTNMHVTNSWQIHDEMWIGLRANG